VNVTPVCNKRIVCCTALTVMTTGMVML
jgi:hypothetical protein